VIVRFGIQFAATYFPEISKVCYRVFAASPPMRLEKPGSPRAVDCGFLLHCADKPSSA
jgi:hypothetical protein